MARRSARVLDSLAAKPSGRAPRSLTVVAEEVGVLDTDSAAGDSAEATVDVPQVAAPTVTPRKVAAPPKTPDASHTPETFEGDAPEWLLDLVIKRRRPDAPTASRLINVPASIKDRFDATSRRLEIDPRLGQGLHPLNASAVLEEACRRYAANPGIYPAADTSRGSAKFAGHVTAATWNAMEIAWAGSTNRGLAYGAHLASVIAAICDDIDQALPQP